MFTEKSYLYLIENSNKNKKNKKEKKAFISMNFLKKKKQKNISKEKPKQEKTEKKANPKKTKTGTKFFIVLGIIFLTLTAKTIYKQYKTEEEKKINPQEFKNTNKNQVRKESKAKKVQKEISKAEKNIEDALKQNIQAELNKNNQNKSEDKLKLEQKQFSTERIKHNIGFNLTKENIYMTIDNENIQIGNLIFEKYKIGEPFTKGDSNIENLKIIFPIYKDKRKISDIELMFLKQYEIKYYYEAMKILSKTNKQDQTKLFFENSQPKKGFYFKKFIDHEDGNMEFIFDVLNTEIKKTIKENNLL